MIGYELPTTLTIGGVVYNIRTDYRAVLDVLAACADPELDDYAKTYVTLTIMFPEVSKIPQEHIAEAAEKACEFIDCGQRNDGKRRPRLIDWEHDAPLIIPAVNNVAHTEVRALPYLHWWSFWGYFMEIGESLFSSVLGIRQKKAKGKKLEKYEEEYYRENCQLIDIPKIRTEEDKKMEAYFNKWL